MSPKTAFCLSPLSPGEGSVTEDGLKSKPCRYTAHPITSGSISAPSISPLSDIVFTRSAVSASPRPHNCTQSLSLAEKSRLSTLSKKGWNLNVLLSRLPTQLTSKLSAHQISRFFRALAKMRKRWWKTNWVIHSVMSFSKVAHRSSDIKGTDENNSGVLRLCLECTAHNGKSWRICTIPTGNDMDMDTPGATSEEIRASNPPDSALPYTADWWFHSRISSIVLFWASVLKQSHSVERNSEIPAWK